jgi:DNA adenine methylase
MRMTITLDPDDERAVNTAIATYQRLNRWPEGGTLIPEGESDLAGAIVAEICRAYLQGARMNPLPNYPGAKEIVAKRLISMMPPHDVYVEGFLGSGAVLRLKRPARLSIGIDLDPRVIDAWSRLPATPATAARIIIHQNDFLKWAQAQGGRVLTDRQTLVYLDPPYLLETRTRLFYAEEMHDPLRHSLLLAMLQAFPCQVMISHYPCEQYDQALADWRRIDYMIQTHGGPRVESVYCNFPEPATFHDHRFQGEGFRERERIKRKSRRWQSRFLAMPAAERAAVAAALAMVDPAAVAQAWSTARALAAAEARGGQPGTEGGPGNAAINDTTLTRWPRATSQYFRPISFSLSRKASYICRTIATAAARLG